MGRSASVLQPVGFFLCIENFCRLIWKFINKTSSNFWYTILYQGNQSYKKLQLYAKFRERWSIFWSCTVAARIKCVKILLERIDQQIIKKYHGLILFPVFPRESILSHSFSYYWFIIPLEPLNTFNSDLINKIQTSDKCLNMTLYQVTPGHSLFKKMLNFMILAYFLQFWHMSLYLFLIQR